MKSHFLSNRYTHVELKKFQTFKKMILNATSINKCDNFLLNSLNTIKNFFLTSSVSQQTIYSPCITTKDFGLVFYVLFYFIFSLFLGEQIQGKKIKRGTQTQRSMITKNGKNTHGLKNISE